MSPINNQPVNSHDGGGEIVNDEAKNNTEEEPDTPGSAKHRGSINSCFHIINEFIDPTSPHESEFDEFLAMPDTVTVCSISGEPVLVDNQPIGNGDNTDLTDTNLECKIIPFTSLYNPPMKFRSLQRKVFLPDVEIKVRIISNERSFTTHLLNPNLYTIRLEHGDSTWIIKKRYKHIHYLHQQLRIFRASLNIPFPTKTHRERRTSFKNNVAPLAKRKGKRKGALPRFPSKPEAFVPSEQLDERIKQLEDYLYNLLNINVYRNHRETLNFLQVSHLSFVNGLGGKGKEGEVLKKTGSTQPGQVGCNFCGLLESTVCVRCHYFWSDVMCGSWRKRWFFVKDTCFGYIRPKDGTLKSVILFDQGFEVSSGMYATGLSTGLQISTLTRQIVIKSWTRRKSKEWISYLRETAHQRARDFTQTNQHNSFAPVRTNITASWFVDGSSYMSAVADVLEAAKEEIFIADWWLSPEIYMKRPVLAGDYWRLDQILKRKAEEGVRIFVLLYKEVEMALGLNSYYSKQKLVGEHENIKVLRHPDHAKTGVFLWAHHEKIVVVDQTYAFLGGIDLSYGRWDDHSHRLIDLGSVSQYMPGRKKKTSSTPSGDYNYPSALLPLATATNTIGTSVLDQNLNESNSDSSESTPKTPDSPILPQLEPGDKLMVNSHPEWIKGNTPPMHRKNKLGQFKSNVKTKTKDFIHKLSTPEEHPDKPPEKESVQHQKSIDLISDLAGSTKLFIGKDYVNFIVKDFTNLESPFTDLIDRHTTPRMPWHDVGVAVLGASARDVARHFIQRWNAVKLEKARLNNIYPFLLPKTYEGCENYVNIVSNMSTGSVTCQVLRSVSTWSVGFLEYDTIEQSIHEAYIDTINRAQHYIYIENQFFITSQSIHVQNQIGEALYKRIRRAFREKKIFRVYIVMPLLPAFEGEVGEATGTALHAVTHWNYASISRGKESLLSRLYELGIKDPSEYITYYSLRNHAELHGDPVSELIYVHSKLMIIDDYIAICGSANINDRSMIGKRDSEIAVLLKDESYEPGIINEQPFPCGKFVGSLRKYLFREHLGLLDDLSELDVRDPCAESFYRDVWVKTADVNTAIFENVFKCIPSDNVRSFEELRAYQELVPLSHSDPQKAKKLLMGVKGHLVKLPLEFLSDEILTPHSSSVEGMMPTAVWT